MLQGTEQHRCGRAGDINMKVYSGINEYFSMANILKIYSLSNW
jgi:hypothetical protein